MALTEAQKKQQERHAEYWRRREAENLASNLKEEQAYEKELQRIYKDMLDSCQKEIDAFYSRYVDKEGITIAEAKKRVRKIDMDAYERKAERYVKAANADMKVFGRDYKNSPGAAYYFSDKANEEMRLYNLTMKVNRLEMLKANIGLELIKGHAELETFMEDILQGRTEDELKRQAGILGKTIRNNAQRASVIVNASFHNATFSDRVWTNHSKMKADLSKLIESGMIAGKNPRVLAKDLKKYFIGEPKLKDGRSGAVFAAERLMRTELARVQTEAQRESMIHNGFAQYTFLTNTGCCPICAAISGEHFKVKDMLPGKNAPPMHPLCRCSVAAYEDSDDYHEWLDFLEAGGTTEEFYKQKAQKQIEKSRESATIKEKYGFDMIEGAHSINDDIVTNGKPTCNPDKLRKNCQRCVQAYEFRRRGYDVIAKPKPTEGNNIKWGNECFTDEKGHFVAYKLRKTKAEVEKELAGAPNGARYSIYVSWKVGGAHVFIAEKENGVVRFVDPQTGRTDASDCFERGNEGRFGYFRMDDKKITKDADIIKQTMEKNKHD